MGVLFKCTKCKGIHEKGYKCNVVPKHKKERDKLIGSYKWQKLRLYIIDRDGCLCQRCLHKYNKYNSDKLTVHHILSRYTHEHLVYEESNLITLCQRCNNALGVSNKLDFEWQPKERTYTL